MPRFLHTADWQIGRQFPRFDVEDAAALSDVRLQTVADIAALASAEHVDAVLVAGDVFDAQTVSERTIRRLFNTLQTFSGPWLLLPGNHDAALAESVWTRAQRLGVVAENVRLLLEAGVHEFPELGLAVLAAPLTQRHTHSDLSAWFDRAETSPGLLRIGLAHGSVQGVLAEDIDSPNPIAAERAARAGLAYLALGDWHGTKCIDERSWYAGTPEQERFRDNDAGNVLLVDIDPQDGVPRVQPRRVGQYVWRALQLQFGVDSDLSRLEAELRSLPAQSVLQLTLGGRLDLAGRERLQRLLAETAARQRALLTDLSALQLQPSDEDIAGLHADGYLGEVLAELRERQADAGDTVAREALLILADVLSERAARGVRA